MSVVATQIKKGQCIRYQGDIGIIQNLEHRTPGKGNALIATTIRSVKSGKTKTIRFSSNEKVEIVQTHRKMMEFTYSDPSGFHFMDENYEMINLDIDIVGEAKEYLAEGLKVEVMWIEEEVVNLELPSVVKLKITESSEGIKGNTANNPTKPAILETGKSVQVPLFVKEGEEILVNTNDGTYAGRAS